ncbi:PREDICTED: protein CutA, chloroplastic [Tarenaya hassleriana]|uniref:protein CutA, chloroplastic n=1 Tax=Tarenaya hassleriana TaxID=28532 RepID=UPI00053C0F33|nr:PREDICTED: protein CutA, chloroplastic [Tarenaya hassleriana]
MASSATSKFSAVIVSFAGIRRRLPIVGAFCMLSLGFSTVSLSSSSSSASFKTGCAQSVSFAPLLRSRFSSKASSSSVDAIRMAERSETVPSIVVYVTVPNREAGKKLANSIVQEKLAACVNIVPGIESVYQWEGKIQSDAEELLIIKTRQSLLDALTDHVKANHEYDVPEVIALPITGGSPQYLEWLKNSTKD